MSDTLSIFKERVFKKHDSGAMYLSEISDVDIRTEIVPRVVEFRVNGIVDDYYWFECAAILRRPGTKSIFAPNEAIVSRYSPFIMTLEEYDEYDNNPEMASKLICGISHAVVGDNLLPKFMREWHIQHKKIIEKKCMKEKEIADVVNTALNFFSPDNKDNRKLYTLDKFDYCEELRKLYKDEFRKSVSLIEA